MHKEKDHHIKSPWLHQLPVRDPHPSVAGDATRDVVIVGGGISGVMTAYFTLKETAVHVTLLEAQRIAHGATGHNAGQLVSEFEQSFLELVEKFGTEQAVDAEQDIDRAWTLLETLHREEALTTPMSTFTGYAGYESIDDIERVLKNQSAREEAGLEPRQVFILESLVSNARFIPYRHLFSAISAEHIANLLETNTTHFHAVIAKKRGCMNSALFSEEVVHLLVKRYPDRFTLHEQTPVISIHVHPDNVRVLVHNQHTTTTHTLTASRVVLCTNGFESVTLHADHNPTFDARYHEMVRGLVGSMVGYLEPAGKHPTALSFHDMSHVLTTKEAVGDEHSYFYFTRRPFDVDGGAHSLLCLGGPERSLDDTRSYNPESPFSEAHRHILDTFLKTTYNAYPDLRPRFAWHGLMGYTPTGMRVIGPDITEKNLWYNIGCNGIGLMTATFGGYKIAQLLKGETFPQSAFDPR